MNVRKFTQLSLLLSLAVVMGYVEAIIPVSIGIPGVKLGLANIVTLFILYSFGGKEGFIVGILRVILVGFLFTNLSMVLYSLTGFVLSYALMTLLKKTEWFSIIGVSVMGGISHNIAQLIVASIITNVYSEIIYYGSVLIVSGIIAGIIVGIATKALSRVTSLL